MKLKEQNILFFTRTMRLGGTENVILQMCELLQPHVKKIVVCSCGGVNVEKLNALGIKHYEIPDIDKKSPGLILKVFAEIPKIIKKENITIVHTHHRMATFYMHFLNKLCNVKLVTTLHGSFSDKKFFTKFIHRKVDIIACGKVAKESFVKNYNIDENHITVINNAIKKDENELMELECLNDLPKDCKKVGYIGRLSDEKGVQLLIDAIPIALEKNPNLFFVIAGNGPLEDELKEKVKGIEAHVCFLGYRNDAQNIIKQVDATVLPSFTEGLPLTPIESFAQGVPMVATPAGGTVEIVKNGVNGLLVPIGDVQALADGIVKILGDEEKYRRMSKEAVKTFEDKFSFAKFESEIVNYYEAFSEEKK